MNLKVSHHILSTPQHLVALTPILFVSAIVAPAAPAEAATWCEDEDTSWGFGGQEVECSFGCPRNSLIKLKVDATDPGAAVGGRMACGGISAACSGMDSCVASDGPTRDAASAGSCKGWSSEFWDSGLYVKCEAKPGPFCVPLICPNDDWGGTQSNPTLIIVIMTIHPGFASALLCQGESCLSIPVACASTGSIRTCEARWTANVIDRQ